MITLNKDKLRDKINACWIAKNIGGTIGTPYEGRRDLLNANGFSTPKGEPLPNDDLDLQLVWLLAVEENGIKELNGGLLGEYWLDFIVPHWNEYGIAKANLRAGLLPPLSGHYNNCWRDSNGAWIRTEIWACLFPGCPEKAIRYAYTDACVDHGLGEGTYAAIFVAAMESAAFVISDIRQLIEIGLSKIPESSRVYQSVKIALKAYDDGLSWQEARTLVLEDSKSDLGWFQAPANVTFAVIGLLYGESDFKKTVCTAVNCGDDTDCTGATAGALFGIMHGMEGIPNDCREYIGDEITTISLNVTLARFPKSCTELTNRVMSLVENCIWGAMSQLAQVRKT